ncbi:liver-expressed antimicrobial peptide 2 [Thalassophryne amazonica]|uniref:liver-expressed antimicrobial peptide 2 n=1 Tax=Thalassophryne amazonica TaxID=390379 RepID=UPI001471BC9F|nr:liver-expressed antimicrobial peptide 2 [Thalassophryne amazonica]
MRTLQHRIILFSMVLFLICAIQVVSLPVPEEWNSLIQRTKRSLLWRWNSLKSAGSSCKDHSECATKFCRKNVCSFRKST